jgi:hypothetical protein
MTVDELIWQLQALGSSAASTPVLIHHEDHKAWLTPLFVRFDDDRVVVMLTQFED